MKQLVALLILFIQTNVVTIQHIISAEKVTSVNAEALGSTINKCLRCTGTIEEVKNSLNSGLDVYADFNGMSPVYVVLNFIAKTPNSECAKAIEIFNLLAVQPNIDINKRYRILLPPLPYLIRKNLEYLNGEYNSNYIPASVVKLLITRGASVNSLDQKGNNLLTFATKTKNTELYEYLTNNGININRSNNSGHDPMYIAIQSQNITAVQQLMQSGYEITPKKLKGDSIDKILPQNNIELIKILSEKCVSQIVTLDDAQNFKELFPKNVHLLLSNEKQVKALKLAGEEIKEYLNIANVIPGNLTVEAKMNVDYLKGQYNNYLQSQYVQLEKQAPLYYLNNNCTDEQYSGSISLCEQLDKLIYQNNFDPDKIKNKLNAWIGFYKLKLSKQELSVNDFIYIAGKNSRNVIDWINSRNADDIKQFGGYNIFIGGTIHNNSNVPYKIKVQVTIHLIKTISLAFVSEDHQNDYDMVYLLELKAGETKPFLTCFTVESSGYYIKSTTLKQSVKIADKSHNIHLENFNGEISEESKQNQDKLLKNFITYKNLKSDKGFFDMDLTRTELNVYYGLKKDIGEINFAIKADGSYSDVTYKTKKEYTGYKAHFILDPKKNYTLTILGRDYIPIIKPGVVQMFIDEKGNATFVYKQK